MASGKAAEDKALRRGARAGRAALPPLIVAYVRWVEAVGRFFGRICMCSSSS